MKDNLIFESTVLKEYRSFMLGGALDDGNGRGMVSECNAECRHDAMCTIEAATRQGYETCLLERDGQIYKGRDIIGIVAAFVFVTVAVAGIFTRVRRRKRQHYDSTPSVGNEVR